MRCELIEEAMKLDKKLSKNRKRFYTDEEIMLAGAWFDHEISAAAIAKVMKINRKNVPAYMAAALRQAIKSGRVGFVWYPKKGTEDGKRDGKSSRSRSE